MAQALRAGLRNGGIRRGGLRPGLGNGSLFAIAPLDMFFARNRTLDPRVTFTRASSGTYVGSDGVLKTATTNAPRFDHNPTTGGSLGLLVEEARTNICLQSEDFSTTWTVAGTASITTNQAASPSGAQTADRLTVTSGGPNRVVQAGLAASSTSYVFTVYVKSEDINAVCIRAIFSGGTTVDAYSNFNFSSRTFTDSSGVGTFGFSELPNGWFRLTIIVSSGNNIAWEFRIGGTIITAQTGTKFFVWGAQLEAGAFPTSYIPTTTATATRSADVASITGANFSSWYSQSEGTVFADATVLSTSKANQTISFNDSTLNNRFELRLIGAADTYRTDCVAGGVTKFSNQNFASSGTRRIAALAVKANDFRLQSGASGISPASDAVPTVDRLYLNYATFAGGEINGTIRRLCYWGQRLPNSTLQQITQ